MKFQTATSAISPLRLAICSAVSTAVLLLLASTTQLANAQTNEQGQLGPHGQTIAAAVNQARADAGLGHLAVNPLLSIAAQAHVNDMIANYRYGHQGSDGSYAAQRVARTGYADAPWVSENWVSSRDPASAMQWWMGDYIHRVNILTPRWVEIGVGVGRRSESGEMIFVTVFSAGTDAQGAVLASASQAPVPAVVQAVPAGGLDYTVQPGDTLLAIALRFGLEWQEVARANGLSEQSLIQIGQVVRIPGPNQPAPVAHSEELRLKATDSGTVKYSRAYTVQPGDTLFTIAARNGLTWQQLSAGNGLGEQSVLQIGQVIYLPATVAKDVSMALAAPPSTGGESPAAPTGATQKYRVQSGDTMISIAFRNGLDWEKLMAINGFTAETILQPGQEVLLP